MLKLNQFGRVSRGTVFTVVFFAFLIIAGLAAGNYFLRDNNSTFVPSEFSSIGNQFVENLVRADAEKSYDMMTAALQQQLGDKSEWIEETDKIFRAKRATSELKEVSNFSVVADKNKQPEAKRLNYEVRFSENEIYTMYVVVYKINNTHKINEYDSSKKNN